MNNAPADGNRNGLRAVVGPEFLHDVLDMNLDCALGDEEPLRDIAVSVSLSNLLQDLDLARR